MKLSSILIVCSVLVATLTGSVLKAQNINANINAIHHPSYAGVASQFALTNLTVDGETIYNGSGYLFCVDYMGKSLDEDSNTYPRIVNNLTIGKLEDMDVWGRFSNAQNESLARSMAHWYVDNYYESYFLNPNTDINAKQYAFQNVLWEIFGDGGTSAGLSFTNGNINRSKFAPGGSEYSPTLWSYMNSMLNDVKTSGVTSDYVPTYEILAALDSRPDHQDYFLLAANPAFMAVPEPSSVGAVMLGALLLLARRRR